MYQEVSTISPIGYAFFSCMGVLLLVLPRRLALVPLFMSVCYMTLGQVLMVGPFHFSIFRIILVFGWIRVITKRELSGFRFGYVDKALLTWAAAGALIYVLKNGATTDSIVGQLGTTYNIVGSYFLIRVLVRNMDDVIQAVKQIGYVTVPLAVFFVVENTTARNVFSIFGGVSEITYLREGKLRCQGAFSHPILAGTFAATAMPLFVGLWVQNRKRRLLAASAFAATAIIMFLTSSSGPLIAWFIGLLGLLLWYYRQRMRLIRWGILLTVVSLHLFMNAPVWFVFSHLSDLLGMGSGWHRAALIDSSIRHLDEWWLAGTSHTSHWMPTGLEIDPNNTDITNQFLSEGVRGGLLPMVLFIWVITRCFKVTGMYAKAEKQYASSERYMAWALGCALVGHVASFMSVSYFDQMFIFWYFLLASIACLPVLQKQAAPARVNFYGTTSSSLHSRRTV